ncbi:MAG: aldehyde dehydrogenase [Steroidobacteraceae bacterium]|nr:aldehyde dehydrogenase [Nevskiaceae bacterium]MCP5467121.1 aldehyde dehydrogenase [Nevskiaceae bacterium]MCP5472050.1 aldehyde dehydrogenase [Nevskiaceae bacterium]
MSAEAITISREFPVNPHVTSLIDGESIRPKAGGEDFPVGNPTTEQQISKLREADPEEVDAAVRSARRAFDSGPWPRMDINERKDICYSIRDHLRKNAEELAYLECLNTGLPLHSVRVHVQRMARNFEFFAEVASTMHGETYNQTKGYLTVVTREPKGVCAAIAPWNAPLALASMRIATVVPFGNTCVLKPSEYTPLSMRRMVEIFHEAGLPPGVVNLVNGRGAVTGNALVSNPDIDMIGFTGGTITGRAIAATAGRNLKPIALELGGKSANIILESANLERALDGALAGIFGNNGQQCLAGSRILVQRSIADRFIEQFVARARQIRLGDPRLPTTEVGPLAFRQHMERVLSFVQVAEADGAKLLTGGKRATRPAQGWFVEPTAVLAPHNDARVCQEEIFGPFATLLTFDTLDEAIAIANASKFGLVNYVWSDDLKAVMRCSQEIRAGTVWVNTPMMRELRAPFGGYKESGIGRDGPTSSIEFCTELKATIIPTADAALPRYGA